MLDVCLLGTGGMMPLPDRKLTALMTRYNGSHLLIDCGEGTQVAIKEMGWSFKRIETICLTHYHADHIGGLVGLLSSMCNAAKTDTLTVIGPKGLDSLMFNVRALTPVLPFPVKLIEVTDKECTLKVNGYTIDMFRVKHGLICYGYSIRIPRLGKCDPAKAERNCVPIEYWTRLQQGEVVHHRGRELSCDMILGPARKGLKVTYCTDTRPVDSIVTYAADADLFVCEGMYGSSDDLENACKYKHMIFSEAAELAARAGVNRFWLTHYSPVLVHPAQFKDELLRIFPKAELGFDGKHIELVYVD